MRNIRLCNGENLATGKSGCQIDFGKIRAIILVEHGKYIPFGSADNIPRMVHGALTGRQDRAFPITDIVEYAKNGGEPQTSSVGYGGMGVTGVSARTDTFTLARYSEHLAASIMKNMNRRYDAYYVDENSRVYGISKGDDNLYGFPLNTVYCTPTPHPTSSAPATLTVSLCFENARHAIEAFDYIEPGYSMMDLLDGLVSVDLVEVQSGKYKIVETMGGYDRTDEFGAVLANSSECFVNVTACTYNNGLLTLTVSSGTTPTLKQTSFLYGAGVQGIEYNRTVMLPAS